MLSRLCARYLTQERGRGNRALDPVAHFHLSNGARVERLNWQADLSPKGKRQSAGMMVNYLYRWTDRGQPRGLCRRRQGGGVVLDQGPRRRLTPSLGRQLCRAR